MLSDLGSENLSEDTYNALVSKAITLVNGAVTDITRLRTDFGSAKALSSPATPAGVASGVLGTPCYLAPEAVDALAGFPADVWAAGDSGTLLHYDGKAWSAAFTRSDGALYRVFRSGPRELWATGYGHLRHFDGTTWQSVNVGSPATLTAGWASDATHVWLAGESGTIMRYGVPPGHSHRCCELWGRRGIDCGSIPRESARERPGQPRHPDDEPDRDPDGNGRMQDAIGSKKMQIGNRREDGEQEPEEHQGDPAPKCPHGS